MRLRSATAEDAQAIAIVHRAAMRVSLSFLPELHTAAEDLAYFTDQFLPTNDVWVAEVEGEVAGYIGFNTEWINHLYVLPSNQGMGLGVEATNVLQGVHPRVGLNEAGVATLHFLGNPSDERAQECPPDACGSSGDDLSDRR